MQINDTSVMRFRLCDITPDILCQPSRDRLAKKGREKTEDWLKCNINNTIMLILFFLFLKPKSQSELVQHFQVLHFQSTVFEALKDL